MRIEWATVVRQYVDGPEGIDLLGVGVDTTYMIGEPPWVKPVTVAYGLLATYEDMLASRRANVSYSILGPDMQPAMDPETEAIVLEAPGPLHREGWDGRIVRGAVLGLSAESEGAFTVQIALDGKVVATLPYYVSRLPA